MLSTATTRKVGPRASKLWSIPTEDIEMVHRYELGGKLQFEVCRFWKHARSKYSGAKIFPRYVGADGRWYFGQGKWKGRRDKPLYRQDEALNELRLGGKAFIVEGERDADALWDLGLIGTCSGGAGSFRSNHALLIIDAMNSGDDHLDPDVAGMAHSTITIVADNDASGTGLDAGKSIYKLLTAHPRLQGRVDLVVMTDGRKDLADFLSSAGSGDRDG